MPLLLLLLDSEASAALPLPPFCFFFLLVQWQFRSSHSSTTGGTYSTTTAQCTTKDALVDGLLKSTSCLMQKCKSVSAKCGEGSMPQATDEKALVVLNLCMDTKAHCG